MIKHFTSLFIALLSMVAGKALAYDAEIDGIFYNFNGDEAEVTFKQASSIFNYSGIVCIPESITYNGKTFPVTSIGESAFFICENLISVTLPNSIKSIGNGAFRNNKSLTSVTLGNSIVTIGDLAFFSCNNLTSIDLPNSVTSIGNSAFSECRKLKTIVIPNSVKTIGNGLFDNCTSLESVILGNSITTISDHMFENCNSLNTISISSNVEKIGIRSFYLCKSLTSIIIPNSVTTIDEMAFYESGLRYVSIGNSVETIGQEAFYRCSDLEEVNILDLEAWMEVEIGYHANPLQYSKKLLLNGNEVKEVIIPNSVTEIKDYAFAGLPIQSLTIGSGVLSIGTGAFGVDTYDKTNYIKKTIWLTNTPPRNYQNAAGIVNYVSNDQYNFSGTGRLTYVYPLLSSMFAIDGVKYVPTSMADKTCDAYDAVYNESAALTKISTDATYRGVTFKVQKVNPYTCCGNTYVKKLELGEGLPYINDHVFDGCTNMQSVKLPETVTWLGKSSFKNCASLKEIAIPAATNEVMHNVFKGCTSLQNVIMNDGSGTLTLQYNFDDKSYDEPSQYGANAPLFEDCPLDKVYIGRNIVYGTTKEEGYSPFYRNTSLREVEITDRETEISENEFYGCTGLKSMKIGDGVTTFGNWAFSGCSSLDYFEFGSSVKTIGTEAFSDCSKVTRIISRSAMPPACGAQAMDDINKWDCTLTVPNGSTVAYQTAEQWKEFLFTQDYTAYVTGIKPTAVSVATKDDSVFSLSGQRLTAPRKGINIIRGRKFSVK